jgi:hypothetical protein
MEKFDKLTSLQKDLINGLIKEFTTTNPKTSGSNRFTFDSINKCETEKKIFKETIAKHNKTMVESFLTLLKSDIKDFEREFGSVIRLEMGHKNDNGEILYGLDMFNKRENEYPLDENRHNEIRLYFVSKSKSYGSSDIRYDYFNKAYHYVYVSLKRERVKTTLESGEVVYGYKVIGLCYSNYDWLNADKDYAKHFSSLDEMVQNHKDLQQKIVYLGK